MGAPECFVDVFLRSTPHPGFQENHQDDITFLGSGIPINLYLPLLLGGGVDPMYFLLKMGMSFQPSLCDRETQRVRNSMLLKERSGTLFPAIMEVENNIKYPLSRLDSSSRDLFSTSMIMGGRVGMKWETI